MDSTYPKISDDNDDGFVLVAVIWIAGLLAVIATAFVLNVRSHTLLARNTVFNTKAEFVADGMTKMMALKLSSLNSDASVNRSGETLFCKWSPEISVAWRIQDQAGLVDINTASPLLLLALLKGLGFPAEEFAAALVDFRDTDSVGSKGGPEVGNYSGKTYGPKNAPISVVTEIDQLPGMNDQSLSLLLPLLTVHTQQLGFDTNVAPDRLRKLLGASGRLDPILNSFSSPSTQKTFSIDVLVETKQKARFYRKAFVTLLLQPDQPFAIVSWERGRDSGGWTFPPEILQPCVN
jgi:general secretion pathway protein K